jgi:hypothetical protein
MLQLDEFFRIFEFDDIGAIQHYKLRLIFVYYEYQRNDLCWISGGLNDYESRILHYGC